MAVVVLVILAVLDLIGGALNLTQATLGVGAIGAACLFAIFARMAQARQQHRELLNAIRVASGQPLPTGQPAPAPRNDGRWECPSCGYANGAQFFDCTRCRAQRP